MHSLRLLSDPAWDGVRLPGSRSLDLFAALHRAGGSGASIERLVEALRSDERPSNAGKALQVVVSRTRAATAAGAVERTGHGYRLGPCEVDAADVDRLADAAAVALANGDVATAIAAADAACAFAVVDDDSDGPLAEVRRRARARQSSARRTRALALSQQGAAADALPSLVAVHEEDPRDDEVLVALLLDEAAVRGPAAALERFERHRGELSDRLGVDPSPALQRVHAQLLAAERPERQGVRYDADDLVGRDVDLGALLGLLANHRVVTILGPGGLGKTRMAHVVARHAAQPLVHVVELVGVRDGDDVVGEVGSTLGVRDSVTALGQLTPRQRSDLRARIASSLDRSPTLLVLDNCEHLVVSVAELVAFLVATTRDLRVLTTSRRPLAIAAERVHLLDQLDGGDAATLFELRARSARPTVVLDSADVADVADVVSRLDGLPLAIELAAAKVRVMSVAEIGRRLQHRFDLLRGGDRSAPDRHQTLLAVIDWSWSLLAESQRRALRRLSVFSDGFTLDAAEVLVGPDAIDEVAALVDQSLLSVVESDDGVRYRMLETVREFGLMHLVDAGDDGDAYAEQRRWAVGFVSSTYESLFSERQPDEVARLLTEETNLSDVLRRSLAAADLDAVVVLMGALGALWTIRGEHARVMMLTRPVDEALLGYRPAAELAEPTRLTAVLLATSALIVDDGVRGSRELLAMLGPGSVPTTAALVRVMTALGGSDLERAADELTALTADPDRLTRSGALRWSAQFHENSGDAERARAELEEALALWRPEDGVWGRAMLRMTLAQLDAQTGDVDQAARHAALALPDLLSLQATDDAIDARSIQALAAIRADDLETAERLVAVNAAGADGPWIFGGAVVNLSVRAEVELARGRIDQGLATYREMADAMRRPVPGLPSDRGLEPWSLYGLATATAAHALHGTGADLYDELVGELPDVLGSTRLDYPVLGIVLYAVGLAGLENGKLAPPLAAELIGLADRFNYARLTPSLSWDNAVAALERHDAKGDLDAALARYGDRRGSELLDDARSVVERLAA